MIGSMFKEAPSYIWTMVIRNKEKKWLSERYRSFNFHEARQWN